MSLGSIVGSSEFAAALGGAGSAFLLEALRRWLADSTKKQASINLALLSLGEMYTVLKNFHDQVFIEPRAALAATLGRDPLPFEFKPAIGMSDHGLSGHHPYRSTRSATGGLHMTLTIKQQLRIKKFFGTSESAVKSQVWIAVATYVLVSIVRKRFKLDLSVHTMLQVLSVTPFEKIPLIQLFSATDGNPEMTVVANHLILL